MKRLSSWATAIGIGIASLAGATAAEKSAADSPAGAAEAASTATLPVFDGREGEVKNRKLSEVDLALVEADVRKKSKEDFLKKQTIGSDFDWKEEFKILDVAEGSFTKPGAEGQRAVLYRYSYTNGVVILSDGDIVAHYSGGPGDYAFYTAIRSLPDVNRNGLSEILLFRNVEDTEEIIPYLFEAKEGKVKFLGEARYFDSSAVAGEDADAEKAKQTAYVVTVEPGKTPGFVQDVYERTGSKGKWQRTKQGEKFSWKTRDDEVYDLTKIG